MGCAFALIQDGLIWQHHRSLRWRLDHWSTGTRGSGSKPVSHTSRTGRTSSRDAAGPGLAAGALISLCECVNADKASIQLLLLRLPVF